MERSFLELLADRAKQPLVFLKSLGLSTAVVAALLAVGAPAAADHDGSGREQIMQELREKFGEKPIALGIAANGGVIEVFAAKEGETWTMVLTMPNGASTIVASGESWTFVEPPGMPVKGCDLPQSNGAEVVLAAHRTGGLIGHC